MSHSDTKSTAQHKSFRNDADAFLPEALSGFIASHPDATWHDAGFIGLDSAIETQDGQPAVALVSGGGSGHEPMHAGFLGQGMLAAVCPGLLFTSPNAVQVTEATKWADQGRGVVHIVKNYTGDVMNFTVARRYAEGVDTREVLVADDVATDKGDEDGPGRRGTGATIIVEKIAGAAAKRGDDLDAVADIATRTAEASRSMSVALGAGFLPTTGRETFDLDPGQMEVGVGIHGEPGVDNKDIESAADIVEDLLGTIIDKGSFTKGDRVICLVNGLGGATPLELSLLFGEANKYLAAKGITVARSMVGTYVTSVNMHGASITLTKVDDEMLALFDAPTAAPAWPHTLAGTKDTKPAEVTFEDRLPKGGEDNAWLTAFLERLQPAFDELTELDRRAGDGDFGQNMEAAFGSVQLPLRGGDSDVLRGLAQRMLVLAGGTSGAVYGVLFNELAAGLDNGSSTGEFAAALKSAVEAIAELGGAKRGDRTVLDALIPAAERAAELDASAPLGDSLAAIHEAAHAGALETRELDARKGRASYLGERSKGVADPGAIVASWLFGGSGKVSEFN
ncbi:dihydroxyacetone kinase family protein [Corynebacterium endometrii]|uniref:PTS-dependent dihydroxyacetone kinase, dihydroxyacetone-binding subunit DhaK n=1 Tax=Corynebacterium endometrii TaxID=2488819 RepID=A0A4P7QCR8_9CORY|nr:dihydroxyacetone kinase family protein [Corynebacterium endometrii]QCB27342.1 PTS-dependent dihydroxyacetone kinase, dihydroxyacetone-binding subunit DhaK [Corynebacterium endometrii]